jgi:hypothetical protein
MLGYHLSEGLICQQKAIIIVTDAPVDEWVGHWNTAKKQYEVVEYVAVKIAKLLIMSDNSICLMCCLGGIFCHCSLSAILRKKIGKPKKEIGSLNGFEYVYLSEVILKYHIFIDYPPYP